MKFIQLLIVLIFFQSCNGDKKIAINKELQLINLIEGDIIESIKTVYFDKNKLLSIHNDEMNCIRIFNINNDSSINIEIPIDSIYGEFRSFLVHSPDSIFIKYEFSIIIKNIKDEIVSIIPFKGFNIVNNNNLIINDFDLYAPLIYLPQEKSFIFRQYPYDINYLDLDFYNFPVFCKFSLLDNTFKNLNIRYPNKYSKESFGGAGGLYYANSHKYLFYSFSPCPELYKFSFSEDKEYIHNTSREDSMTPFDLNNKNNMSLIFEHITTNDISLKVLIDNENKLIYRFLWKKISLINKDNTFNSIGDKDIIIEVFDENGKYLCSTNLGKNNLWATAFVLNGSIYIAHKDLKLNHQKYDKISVNVSDN